jgi:hypothetical protein
MTINTYQLLGGMTLTVGAIIYQVIAQRFYIPDENPAPRRRKTKQSKVKKTPARPPRLHPACLAVQAPPAPEAVQIPVAQPVQCSPISEPLQCSPARQPAQCSPARQPSQSTSARQVPQARPTRQSSPVIRPCDSIFVAPSSSKSSSGTSTVVATPPRVPSITLENDTMPTSPPPTELQKLQTLLDTSSAQNVSLDPPSNSKTKKKKPIN